VITSDHTIIDVNNQENEKVTIQADIEAGISAARSETQGNEKSVDGFVPSSGGLTQAIGGTMDATN
jgi:hypothetical protein